MNNQLYQALELQNIKNYKDAKDIYFKFINSKVLEERIFAIINLANIFFVEANFAQATKMYQYAIEIDSKNQKAYYNYGVLKLKEKEYEKANELFIKSLELNSTHYSSSLNNAIALKNLKRYDESYLYFKRCLQQKRDDIDLYYNLGNLYLATEKYALAFLNYKRADKIRPNSPKILYSFGLIYHRLLRNKEAIKYFEKAIELKENYYDALFAKSLALLHLGDYKNGWEYYKYRFEASNELKRVDYDVKHYDGEDLSGKTILIQGEQGFGDNIEFSRFLNYLKRAKKIYLAVRDPLILLLQKSFDFVEVISDKSIIYNIDYYASLMELPRIFSDKNIFEDTTFPYITFEKKSYDFEFLRNKFLKIGFSWQGNLEHKNDHNRSISLEYFEKLFQLSHIEFFSFQIDNKENINDIMNRYKNVYDLSVYIKDFNDSANLIEKMDCVITIDSSLVHLCGALNKKAFLLLPKYFEWRWQKNSTYSWYDSIEQIVQDNSKDWESSFDKLFHKLKELRCL